MLLKSLNQLKQLNAHAKCSQQFQLNQQKHMNVLANMLSQLKLQKQLNQNLQMKPLNVLANIIQLSQQNQNQKNLSSVLASNTKQFHQLRQQNQRHLLSHPPMNHLLKNRPLRNLPQKNLPLKRQLLSHSNAHANNTKSHLVNLILQVNLVHQAVPTPQVNHQVLQASQTLHHPPPHHLSLLPPLPSHMNAHANNDIKIQTLTMKLLKTQKKQNLKK